MREWSSPLKLLEPRPPLGPESTQRLGLPSVGTVGGGGGTGRARCGPGPGRSRMTRPLCLSQRGPASHTAVPRGHNARLKSKTSRDTELFLPAAPSPRSIPSQGSVQGTDSVCDAAPSLSQLQFCRLWRLSSGPRVPGADSEDILPSSKLGSGAAARPTAGWPVPRPPLPSVLALIPPPETGPSEGRGALTLLFARQVAQHGAGHTAGT